MRFFQMLPSREGTPSCTEPPPAGVWKTWAAAVVSFSTVRLFKAEELIVGDLLRIGPFSLRFDGRFLQETAGTTGARVDVRDLEKSALGVPVLSGISLSVSPCQFVGVIGPSGAGKSTLLDALCALRPADSGTVSGSHSSTMPFPWPVPGIELVAAPRQSLCRRPRPFFPETQARLSTADCCRVSGPSSVPRWEERHLRAKLAALRGDAAPYRRPGRLCRLANTRINPRCMCGSGHWSGDLGGGAICSPGSHDSSSGIDSADSFLRLRSPSRRYEGGAIFRFQDHAQCSRAKCDGYEPLLAEKNWRRHTSRLSISVRESES